ncbi:protein tesmin/TSO1-like CXC 5 isoform X1 [Gossypium australe]|uniref:Protein tesmin/TSO1-like CXC 5 isoform X1 n=1 Tax=Gossypium australe TaxID=47621 RepID=A0A5B6X790_9ROSI|nr:protein tesmin/TSO1-like CXC 5 isoform X1 [Gossypium australe]
MHFGGRSLLADIIQKQDLKELCSVLVVLSREAAKILADQRSLIEGAEDHSEIFLASSTQDRLESQKDFVAEKTRADNCSSANQAVKSGPENSCTDVADMPEGRPMSPGALALMCDEQDTAFTAAASLNGIMDDGYCTSSQLPCGKGMIEIDAEHERVVLTKFRDCLNRLITFGEIKGKFLNFGCLLYDGLCKTWFMIDGFSRMRQFASAQSALLLYFSRLVAKSVLVQFVYVIHLMVYSVCYLKSGNLTMLLLSITGMHCSKLARIEIGSQRCPLSHRAETGNQQGFVNYGVPKTIFSPKVRTSKTAAVVTTADNDLPTVPPFPGNGDAKSKPAKQM